MKFESLDNEKFKKIERKEMKLITGNGTFWIGDSNCSNESNEKIDVHTSWNKDSTSNEGDGICDPTP